MHGKLRGSGGGLLVEMEVMEAGGRERERKGGWGEATFSLTIYFPFESLLPASLHLSSLIKLLSIVSFNSLFLYVFFPSFPLTSFPPSFTPIFAGQIRDK